MEELLVKAGLLLNSRVITPSLEPQIDVAMLAQTHLPVSPLQRSMLFGARLAPDKGLNLEQVVLRFSQPIDMPKLRHAWEKTLSRHPALRSVFIWVAGHEPTQEVLPEVPLDWSEDSSTQRSVEDRLEEYLASDRRRGFTFDRPPLSRFRLFHPSDATSPTILVWTFPHAILDGRSIHLVITEVLSRCSGQATAAKGVPDNADADANGDVLTDIASFATWLSAQESTHGKDFWSHTLHGCEPKEPISLGPPPERSDAAKSTAPLREAPSVRESWDARFTSRVRAFAEKLGTTPNTVLQGAFAFALSRHIGTDDLLISAVRNGRHWDGRSHPDAIGLFMVNPPVRFRFEPGVTVADWLRALRDQHMAIRPFEHTPMDRLHEWISWPGGSPLFEAVFQYEPLSFTDRIHAALPQWRSVSMEIKESAGVPLVLSVYGTDSFELNLEYDPTRFTKLAVERLLGHVRTACEAFINSTDQPIHSLALQALNDELRAPEAATDSLSLSVPFPTRSVVEWVSDQVKANPSALAIQGGDHRLSYGELDELSNRLAHHLIHQGCKPGTFIGLCAERTPWTLAGLMGILKAGCAVASIDPGLPPARRDFIFEDAAVSHIVCDLSMAAKLGETPGTRILLDAPDAAWKSESTEPLSPPALELPSYLVYTSGTTGNPKGVVNNHRGLSNEAIWARQVFPVMPDERTLHMANLSFDAAFEEIFATLTGGGALICRPPEAMDSLRHFHEAILREQITLLDLTTSFWAQWVAWMEREKESLPASLRVMVVGGEKTQQSTYAIWQQLNRGRVRWLNTYGPTEAAIVSTVFISPDQPGRVVPMGEVPIGRPLPHTYVRLLDKHRREVPAGAAGELLIGGVGVADGYHNRPDLTAKAFIPDPLSEEPTARLYRTGDLVRMTEDGEIEYMGRADNQVKIRGFRIELDEVENALSAHPGTAESVVITLTDGGRISGLAAYVVLRDPSLTVAAIKQHLMERLPPHAVPGAIIVLPKMPLTGNGKVDRRALPKPEATVDVSSIEAPETPLETDLERIFARVLRRDRVGVNENFQQAGGDSFMVMELIELAMQQGHALHPETLFRFPTVRQLASHIATTTSSPSTGGKAATPSLSPITVLRDSPSGPVLYLAHATPGDVMGYGNLVHHLDPKQAVCGFNSLGLVDPDRAHSTIEDMAAWYVKHLLEHQSSGPYHLAGWCYGGTVVYEMARQLAQQGHEVGLLGLIDCYAPLAMSPLLRLKYRLRQISLLLRCSPSRQFSYVAHKLGRPTTVPVDVPPPKDLLPGTSLANREIVRTKNMEAIFRYRWKPYTGTFDVFVSTLVGDDFLYDPTGGWSLYTERAEYHHIDADHRAILKEPAVRLIAAELQDTLHKWRSSR